MHQQARIPSRVSTPSSPRSSNSRPREAFGGSSRTQSGSGTVIQEGIGIADTSDGRSGPSKDSVKKLDQIIQNFYSKAATLILKSRMKVTPQLTSTRSRPEPKRNKWFQIDTEEIIDFKDELQIWKTCGGFEQRPPPMIIEVYLDASRLSKGQSLVIHDEDGKRWDVAEALSTLDTSSDNPVDLQKRRSEVVLERWRIELKGSSMSEADDFGPILPTIYKKSIVFFRSLFVATLILPTFKFAQQSISKRVHPSLDVRCRILTSETEYRGFDPVRHPLYESREQKDVAADYIFGDLEVPVGRFYASVTYRHDCTFRVADSESLLSSHFVGIDEYYFKPSVPQRDGRSRDYFPDVGSLPSRQAREAQDVHQTYGSLSTFHGDGAMGTSPISALRAIKPVGSEASSPTESIPSSQPRHVPYSLPISTKIPSSNRPSLRTTDHGRRPSISFNPFKTGSLSGSSPLARPLEGESPASPSATRPPGPSVLAHGRKPSSLTQGMAASLRGGPPSTDTAASSSPKPVVSGRFSSSFTHRRGRLSFGGGVGASKPPEDDQGSSGKQSLASSVAQPGSGLLTEAGGSSGSLQQDQDDIADFLKALDSKKTLQSFESPKKGESSTARKTVVQLSRFQMMKESNTALTESMTSSIHLHRSSSSSSRQLTSVPGMVPASLSTASSPGKPLSPHTPHTPAIPSRLSENSIIDYPSAAQVAPRRADLAIPESIEDTPVSQEGTTAIDIPLSPRLPHGGRSSSVAIRDRSVVDEANITYAAERRSLSLGNDEGEPPTLSALLSRNANIAEAALEPSPSIMGTGGTDMLREASSSVEKDVKPPGGLLTGMSNSPRRRYIGLRQGQTPPSSASGSMAGPNRRYSGAGGVGDDEVFLFDMSELGGARRSTDEGRGGGGAGSSTKGERGTYVGSRGSSRSGW